MFPRKHRNIDVAILKLMIGYVRCQLRISERVPILNPYGVVETKYNEDEELLKAATFNTIYRSIFLIDDDVPPIWYQT